MRQVAVYASTRPSNSLRKESLIYDSIDLAIDAMPDVDWCRPAMPVVASQPGLHELRPHEVIVALGRAAHAVLADYHKRTLVAGNDDDLIEEDVERLIWSCVNTSKVIALGRGAWRSIQLLPVTERRFYEVPPLRVAPDQKYDASPGIGSDVLVINHEDDECRSERVAAALERGGLSVQRTGRGGEEDGGSDHGGWSAAAPIHVHVGCHDSHAEEVRLIDTWHSRRSAILFVPRSFVESPPDGCLMVDAEVNGFLCDTPDKVLAACADLRADPVLRKKMLDAGTISVAPLAREWLSIASELLS